MNARDIGGLALAGGGLTRHGVIVRSDAVHQLTGADVSLLVHTIGIRHVVDLRAEAERAQQTRGLLGTAGVSYSELEVLTDAMIAERRAQREHELAEGVGEAATLIADGYIDFLELGRNAFVNALDRLAAPEGSPALVHCSAGKDRTGVLVALLLDAAGATRDAIIADYAATDERMALVRARLAAMPAYAQMAAEAPAPLLAAHPATMDRFLERLHQEWGGAADWFLAAGAPPSTLDAWRARITG